MRQLLAVKPLGEDGNAPGGDRAFDARRYGMATAWTGPLETTVKPSLDKRCS
jgi:hypothetical protein